MLAITIDGKATGPPPNASARIAAASTSQGSTSRNQNGPNETRGSVAEAAGAIVMVR